MNKYRRKRQIHRHIYDQIQEGTTRHTDLNKYEKRQTCIQTNIGKNKDRNTDIYTNKYKNKDIYTNKHRKKDRYTDIYV